MELNNNFEDNFLGDEHAKYKEKVKETHTYIPDSTTGKPIDNTTNPKKITIPDPSKWPMTFGDKSVSDPFVQRVIDNRELFAPHELEYLEKNCPNRVTKDDVDKARKEIFEDILDQVKEKEEDPYKNPFDKDDGSDDYRDWTKTNNPYSSGMYEKERTVGMFESQKEMQQILDNDE